MKIGRRPPTNYLHKSWDCMTLLELDVRKNLVNMMNMTLKQRADRKIVNGRLWKKLQEKQISTEQILNQWTILRTALDGTI